jgi:CubicO group peptidase (beta-lactamase class C family)
MFSALPLRADLAQCSRHVSKVPKAEIHRHWRLRSATAGEVATGRFLQMRFLWAAIVSVCLWLCAIGSSQSPATNLEQLLKDRRVPGLSFAVISDGKIVETKSLGVRDTSTATPVDENTIFEAASLSKPVFAYAVLQLVDAGQLSLDTPLSTYVPN